jgi:hypothetical protein
MNTKQFLQYTILAALVGFTFALGVNNYNSGVYADAHGLDGREIGWFAPNEVVLFAISALATLMFGVYLLTRRVK